MGNPNVETLKTAPTVTCVSPPCRISCHIEVNELRQGFGHGSFSVCSTISSMHDSVPFGSLPLFTLTVRPFDYFHVRDISGKPAHIQECGTPRDGDPPRVTQENSFCLQVCKPRRR